MKVLFRPDLTRCVFGQFYIPCAERKERGKFCLTAELIGDFEEASKGETKVVEGEENKTETAADESVEKETEDAAAAGH